jgi:hypothetical protein
MRLKMPPRRLAGLSVARIGQPKASLTSPKLVGAGRPRKWQAARERNSGQYFHATSVVLDYGQKRLGLVHFLDQRRKQ